MEAGGRRPCKAAISKRGSQEAATISARAMGPIGAGEPPPESVRRASRLRAHTSFEHPMIQSLSSRLAFPLLLVCAASCGGGGGSSSADTSPSATPTSAALLINTSAGVIERVEGRLLGLMLEDSSGGFSENLLPRDQVVALTDPLGSTETVEIDAVPDGVFVAAHMVFVEDSMVVTGPLGARQPLPDAPTTLRAVFDKPLDNRGGGAPRVQVRHSGDSLLRQISGGRYRFTPVLFGGEGDVALFFGALVEVLRVDSANLKAVGAIGDLEFMLKFDPSTILVREPMEDPISVDAFVDGLEEGAWLLLDGALDGDVLLVRSAVDLEEDPTPTRPGTGRKSKMLGVITSIDADAESYGFDVIGIQKAGRGVPVDFPISLEVQAGDARIKVVPRRGRHRGHLPFSALEPDMLVETEWFDAPSGDGVITAQKVNIRRGRNPFAVCSVRGVITEVDEDSITVEDADGAIGDYVSLPETIFLRAGPDECGLISREELMAGDEALVIFAKSASGENIAQLVRVTTPPPPPPAPLPNPNPAGGN